MRYALVLLAVVMLAQSPPTSPGQSIPVQAQKDKSSSEKKVSQPDKEPSTPGSAESEIPTGANDSQTKNAGNARTPSYTFLGGSITEWSLTIFTLCLVIVGVIQIFIYRKQAEYMRVTNAVAHRPKLAIKFMSLNNPLGPGGILSGTFFVFNTGETGTRLRRSYSEVVVAQRLPADYGDAQATSLTDLSIAPGGFCQLPFPSGPMKEISIGDYLLLANHRDVIRRGSPDPEGVKLFLIGWAEYSDDAGKTRRLGFCRQYNWITGRFDREADPDYEYGDQD